MLEEAFEVLNESDAVVGPAAGGAYYLLGLRRTSLGVFENVDRVSTSVFEQTESNLRQMGLRWRTLKV